jgi:hypothetical protein
MFKHLIIAILCGHDLCANAQDTPKPRHVPYASVSGNYSPGYKVSYSAEAGSWGTTSNTSYGGTFDVVPNSDGSVGYWVGAKLYYTVHAEERLCYMVYVAPKGRLDQKQGLLEYGFNPNYTLSPRTLLSVTLGQQVYASSASTFGSLGVIYFLRK